NNDSASEVRARFSLVTQGIESSDKKRKLENVLKSGDNGGMDDLARRVGNLETKMDKVQEALVSIQVTLARMEASMATKDDLSLVRSDMTAMRTSLEAKATSANVAEIKGRVDALPTMAKLSALVAIGLTTATIILGVYHHGIVAHWW
ncbi:MAG: hypothetical protein ABF979_15285, partial [Gluconobacter sp.]|uniref:hypothetical protein n=1 Tax=Gluconobacter sp. TaxID=1876758 RepID=UPI0039E92F6B